MSIPYRFLALGAASAVILAGAWLLFGSGALTAVEAVHPVRGTAVAAVYATGTVEPTVMLPVAARSAARLVELKADEGSDVKKGDVLAQLEDDDLQSALTQLQAQEEFARTEYERMERLLASGTASRQAYDKARTTWEAARAATAKARVEAGRMKLMAPDNGHIIRRDGEIGELIPANQPVFWLSCCAPLRVAAEVDEEDIVAVKPGQKVLIRADAFPGQVFGGKVKAITPKGDPVARSYRVRIELEGVTPLQIGMTAEANIITREKPDVLLVPSSALLQDAVWLVTNGRLARQPVTVGVKGHEKTEITEGLDEGAVVAIRPASGWTEGRHVRAVILPEAADK